MLPTRTISRLTAATTQPVISFNQHIPALNTCQKRTSIFNRYSNGPYDELNPKPPYGLWLRELFSGGFKLAVRDVYATLKRDMFDEPMNRGRIVDKVENQTYIFEHFDCIEAINLWKPVADSDTLDGNSKAYVSRSADGHLVFSGYLDKTVPKNGFTQMSGFVGLLGPRKRHIRKSRRYWNWTWADTIEIRFRGDGRKYVLFMNCGNNNSDMEYYDSFQFPLYTHGGPYWQTVRVPLSKFYFSYKGSIQPMQVGPFLFRVKLFAITLQDRRDGPFKLEIDYIGLRKEPRGFDESTAYEGYLHRDQQYFSPKVDAMPPVELKERRFS